MYPKKIQLNGPLDGYTGFILGVIALLTFLPVISPTHLSRLPLTNLIYAPPIGQFGH